MKQLFFAMSRICTVLVAFGIPSAGIIAQTQNSTAWERDVRRQLRANAATLSDYDIVASHEIFIGSLRKGYYQDIDYRLEAGVRYVFTGACDRDCTDLDLKLYDDLWNLIAEDTKPDDHPALVITVRRTTTFHLRAIMEKCNANPCWYGTGAYKPASD